MNQEPQAAREAAELDRGTLLRDLVMLQIKLGADGLRDVVLSPISIFAAVISLLKKGPRPGTEFYDLCRWGRKVDDWVGLFDVADRVPDPEDQDAARLSPAAARAARRIEAVIAAECKAELSPVARNRIARQIREAFQGEGAP